MIQGELFSPEEISKCKEIFSKFDTGKLGYLNRDQFLTFQRTLRTETSVEEAYAEFMKWCTKVGNTSSHAFALGNFSFLFLNGSCVGPDEAFDARVGLEPSGETATTPCA